MRSFQNHNPTTVLQIEKQLMTEFREQMAANNKTYNLLQHENPIAFQNEWSLLGQAQHYGLPTRMLDWTNSWEVALYFAVEDNPPFNEHDGQFWIFSVPDQVLMHDAKKELYYEANPFELDKTWLVNPSFFWTNNYKNETAEIRRARQHGKFSIQSLTNSIVPLEQQRRIAPDLEKYCIRPELKGQIRLELASKGIFGDFLYDNEDDTINGIISSLRKKYKLI